MNQFEIKIVDSNNESNESFKEVCLFVDGTNLIELLKQFEKPFAKRENHESLAGAYSGIDAKFVSASRFLGQSDLDYGDDSNKVSVLECECGCEGCWPFAVKITETDSSIVWSDFEQPHRSNAEVQPIWDYSSLEIFEFEKSRYIEEINKLNKFAQPEH